MESVRALIADDEPELIRHLEALLSREWPELEVISRPTDGRQALQELDRTRPDVAFLDIRMPGLSGMAVAGKMGHKCAVIFVTAYDQYAVEAFEREAIDYLLKPVQPERLARTVERTRLLLRATPPDWHKVLRRLDEQLAPGPQYLSWLRVQRGEQVLIVPVEEVVYFQASDKYTSVFTAEREYLVRMPIRDLLEQLDPERFWQIHRSSIVNMAQVAAAEREFAGRMRLRLHARDERLRVSRRYAHLFRQL